MINCAQNSRESQGYRLKIKTLSQQMKKTLSNAQATYCPQMYKTFEGALESFFAKDKPSGVPLTAERKAPTANRYAIQNCGLLCFLIPPALSVVNDF